MSYIKLISSKELIGEIIEDFGVDKTDKVYRMYAWIERGLGIMGLVNYYKDKTTVIEVTDGRGEVPCEAKYVHSFWITSENSNNPYNLSYLPIKNTKLASKPIKGNNSRALGYINHNYLHTNFNDGLVLCYHKSIPKDKEGYPLIPDDDFVKEALPFFIIYKLSLSGYKHPVVDIETASNRWRQLYPAAANSVDWLDATDRLEFSEMWTNPSFKETINFLNL